MYSGTAICRHIELKGEGCLELFEEIPTGSEYQSKGCELLDRAYEIVSSATLGNLTCTEVFGSVNNILGQSDYYDVQYFDGCKVVADANEERLAELMALDPTLDETGIEYCRNLTAYVYSEIEKSLFDQPTDSTNSAPDGMEEAVSLLENFTSMALDFCIVSLLFACSFLLAMQFPPLQSSRIWKPSGEWPSERLAHLIISCLPLTLSGKPLPMPWARSDVVQTCLLTLLFARPDRRNHVLFRISMEQSTPSINPCATEVSIAH